MRNIEYMIVIKDVVQLVIPTKAALDTLNRAIKKVQNIEEVMILLEPYLEVAE